MLVMIARAEFMFTKTNHKSIAASKVAAPRLLRPNPALTPENKVSVSG